MSTPLFSIITISFNSKKYIEDTIKSVLNQKVEYYEYIIVDGGSTDGTLDIICHYEPLFAGRMSWISENDNGIYDAFNKGIRMAKGKYIWLVNSDDYIEPGALSLLSEYISKCPQIISGRLNYVDASCKLIRTSALGSEASVRKAYLEGAMGISHPATLVAAEVYKKVGLYDSNYSIIGDLDWFHRAYSQGIDITFVDVVLSNMREGGISTSFQIKKSYRDRVYFLNKHYNSKFVILRGLLLWLKRWIVLYCKSCLK